MNEEFEKMNGRVQKCRTFTFDEIKKIFNDDGWNRTLKDQTFLKEVGLSAPPTTFLVAGSYSSEPTEDGKIAGICILRTDEKDRSKGFPVNSNHWDFCLAEDKKDKVIMFPSKQKRKYRWFKSEEEWKERITRNPPHEDKMIEKC